MTANATRGGEEITRLKGCISELISIQALPAIWDGGDAGHILTTLLDALASVLLLDFAYARSTDFAHGPAAEVVRQGERRIPPADAREVGRALDRLAIDKSSTGPVTAPNPAGAGEVRIVSLRLGLLDEIGVLVVGSKRADFPTQTEMLLLRVAANQAVVSLQEARALDAQGQVTVELELRVVERTEQLEAANAALSKEVVERRHAETELLALKDELAAELKAVSRLYELGTRLLTNTELQPLLDEILTATMEMQGADFGMVQLYDADDRSLKLVAQHGFTQAVLDQFGRVDAQSFSIGGHALRRAERVIVEDIEADPVFASLLPFAAAAGFWAAQSTALFARDGRILGMISTHFSRPHRLLKRELRLTDIYARRAAEVIEHKQSEAALRKSEAKYRTLFDSIDEGFCTIEMLFDENDRPVDFRFLEINPSFEKQMGIQNARGRRMREIAPLHEEHWFEIYGRIALTGKPARFENPAAQLHRWFDVYAFRVGAPRERKVAILFNDITERKRSEEARCASEERFRHYFELGLIGMAITSPDKGCLEVNDELCRILGYGRSELLQKTWAEMTHPDDLAADVAQFNRVLAGEIDGYTLDKRWICKEGRVINSIMGARCVRRADGSPDYFLGLVLDTTERRLEAEALRKAQEELAHVTRVFSMGELTASIAHEVNQPLAAVVANGNACARWLAAQPPNLTETNAAVQRIVRDANRASDVIARIRKFVKREASQKRPLDLNEVVHEVVEMMRNEIHRHGVTWHIVATTGLPQVVADRVQLQQVLLNVLMNAVEAMAPVSKHARTLEFGIGRYGANALHVTVCDSGVGLHPAHRERVFDAFHTTKPGGMGMGLAISRSIIEAHGGRLWATANEGPGETFQFTLPVAPWHQS